MKSWAGLSFGTDAKNSDIIVIEFNGDTVNLWEGITNGVINNIIYFINSI